MNQGKGTISNTIRQAVRDETDILGVNWPEVPAGQHAVTLYSFGNSGISPEKFTTLVKFKPDMVIVTDADVDEGTPSIKMGQSYEIRPGKDGLTLAVADESPAYFTLVDPSHRHPGSVTYGAFKDGAGELWLFEECAGDYFTSTLNFPGMHNERMVEPTHKYIQAAITLYIDDAAAASDAGPCPAKYSSHHAVSLNSRVDTGIQVKKGDKLTIHASGSVRLGMFAGSGGPEGIQFNPMYSYFPDSPHGCLMGRIRTAGDAGNWAFIGKGDVWNVKGPGTLELDLNDNDPSNNVGEFQVDIDVCRAH